MVEFRDPRSWGSCEINSGNRPLPGRVVWLVNRFQDGKTDIFQREDERQELQGFSGFSPPIWPAPTLPQDVGRRGEGSQDQKRGGFVSLKRQKARNVDNRHQLEPMAGVIAVLGGISGTGWMGCRLPLAHSGTGQVGKLDDHHRRQYKNQELRRLISDLLSAPVRDDGCGLNDDQNRQIQECQTSAETLQ